MPARYSWKGFLRLSLVSVPVQAVNAEVSGGDKIHFHMLHAPCHNRIRYQKICPVHGEVQNSEIVHGYEYAKGQYVIVEDDDLDAVRSQGDKAINIETFVAPDAIDPMYYDGRTYYLLPDGRWAQSRMPCYSKQWLIEAATELVKQRSRVANNWSWFDQWMA